MREEQLVISSNIQMVAYDSDEKVLEVTFKNGSVYDYNGVSEDLFRSLAGAASPGKFLNTYIKPYFSYTKHL